MTTIQQANAAAKVSKPLALSMKRSPELVPAWRVAAAVRKGLERAKWPYQRDGRKHLMRLTGMSRSSASNRLKGKIAPTSAELVTLIREIDEVAEEILRLAGRVDLFDRAAALRRVKQMRRLVEEMERSLPAEDPEHLGNPAPAEAPP